MRGRTHRAQPRHDGAPPTHRPIIGRDRPRTSTLRLTELTDCGGCAAKLGADLLADALAGLGAEAAAARPDELIAGLNPPDDAAVYRVSDDLAIIGTLDFFPPLVDDPRTFGEIAAANALSDVFAMGGRVLFALSIAAFPEELPRDTLTEIFAGAAAKVREAGGTLAGGHTIRDPEPKYGLAVIGAAHPDRLLRKGGAQPGRPARADQAARDGPPAVRATRRVERRRRTSPARSTGCARLNRAAADVLVDAGVRRRPTSPASGSSGHGLEMARASGRGSCSTPPRCPSCRAPSRSRAAGVETGGAAHNRRFVAGSLTIGAGRRPGASSRSPTTRRPRAACSPRSRSRTSPESRRPSTHAGVEHWWIGEVEPASRRLRQPGAWRSADRGRPTPPGATTG